MKPIASADVYSRSLTDDRLKLLILIGSIQPTELTDVRVRPNITRTTIAEYQLVANSEQKTAIIQSEDRGRVPKSMQCIKSNNLTSPEPDLHPDAKAEEILLLFCWHCKA